MNRFTKVKIQWARRLVRSKYFVVLTDKGAAIGLDGVDPFSLDDTVAIKAQQQEIRKFHRELTRVIKEHDQAIDELTRK